MIQVAERLEEIYRLPETQPFSGSPSRRNYVLAPKLDTRGGLAKSKLVVVLTEYEAFNRGRYSLSWASDWGEDDYWRWANQFAQTTDLSPYQTRFERGLQAVENSLKAPLSLLEETDLVTYQQCVEESTHNGVKLNSSQEVQVALGLDPCLLAFDSKGADLFDLELFIGPRTYITIGDFGSDMVDQAIHLFIQSDVPSLEKEYFAQFLKDVIGGRALESAQLFYLEDIRGERLRRYRKPVIRGWGWNHRSGKNEIMVASETDPLDYPFSVEVVKSSTGPVIALDLAASTVLRHPFDNLSVVYTYGGDKGQFEHAASKPIPLEQVVRILNLGNKYRDLGRFRLFVDSGAIRKDLLNVVHLKDDIIPEQLIGWEWIGLWFSSSQTSAIHLDQPTNQVAFVATTKEVPFLNFNFESRLG